MQLMLISSVFSVVSPSVGALDIGMDTSNAALLILKRCPVDMANFTKTLARMPHVKSRG